MKKPIVSDPSKSFGQNVLHDQLQKSFPFKSAVLRIPGLAFNILKSNPAVLIGNDIFFATPRYKYLDKYFRAVIPLPT